MTNNLFLQAVDVWMFRDGRPFDAGSAHRAESVFPPYPTVTQGAFRTARLLWQQIDLKDKKAIADVVGEPNGYGSLRLRGPFLARRAGDSVVRYYPQPADALVNGRELIPATLQKAPGTLKTSASLPMLLNFDQNMGKPGDALWVRETDLLKYLGGEPVTGTLAKDLFEREDRTGIGMDEKRVTIDGMLYEAGFIRPRLDVGLLVEMDGYDELEWGKSGTLHLGGEGRMAVFEPMDVPALPEPPASASRFKVYFATPTYFENGWQPANWSKFFASPVTLVGAALQRYETVGGFNWAEPDSSPLAHRPARRFVPAGSVYYFEGNSQLIPGLTQQAITDFGAEIGFGQTIIKEW